MKPWEHLDSAAAPDGARLTLWRRDAEYVIRLDNQELMSTRSHSEVELGRLGVAHLGGSPRAQVLIGGLGMGFTLRGVLDALGPQAQVVVAEISADVERWNRTTLSDLAGNPLSDPRARVEIADVRHVIASERKWDAILLDVDNGPTAVCSRSNQALYDQAGLWRIRAVLKDKGVLAVWSASDDPNFVALMNRCGFKAKTVRIAAHRGKGRRHFLFLGQATSMHR
ncbi:MAG: spermidine synthase family protein [Candidatus Xenobia bacterium]